MKLGPFEKITFFVPDPLYVACSCSSWGRSMGDYSPLSALSHPIKQTQQSKGWSYAIFLRLHVMPGRSRTHLPSKRHGPRDPQRRVIPLQARIPQPRWRPHVHGRKGWNPHEQQGNPQHLTNNPGRHVIRSRGRTLSPVYQCKNSSLNATNADRTRTPAATHANANRQCNCTRATYKQDSTKSTQSHGHAFPLATVSWRSRPISVLLETRHTDSGRLLHKASPSQTPQECAPNHTNSCQQPRIQKNSSWHKEIRHHDRPTLNQAETKKNHRKYKEHQLRHKSSQIPLSKLSSRHPSSETWLQQEVPKFLQQGCVRPTSRYVSFGGKNSRQSYESP